jgi:cell wall-associated NlpC family hydrolase
MKSGIAPVTNLSGRTFSLIGLVLTAVLSLSGCANLPVTESSGAAPQANAQFGDLSNSVQTQTARRQDDDTYGFQNDSLNKRLPRNPLQAIDTKNLAESSAGEAIIMAMAQLGVAYQRGGSSMNQGFDCSGLTSYVYKKADITLPRTARDQYAFTQRVAKANLKPGDLLFFKIRSRKIDHVAIYVGDNTFIHAPKPGERVQYAKLNDAYWRKHYVGAGRVPGSHHIDIAENNR